MPAAPETIAWLDAHFEARVEELEALARIPSVSADGFPPEEVARSAAAVASQLLDAGFERAEVVPLAGAHPYVIGEWLGAGEDAPTLLLYAHHDVQPPGRASHWETPPFEPTRRVDGRLYARGIVDDKAGVVVFAGALRAWLATGRRPPVNLKIIVEGEEEIGSGHLAEFLKQHHARLSADVLVLSDTANLELGLPSLTTSLRGLLNIDVRVKALDHPVHSGMWGGPVPDATSALARILGRLFDSEGRIAIPGFEEDVPALSEKVRRNLSSLPFDATQFCDDVGLVDSAKLLGESGAEVFERIWYRPTLSIVALEGMPLALAGNQLIAEAAARIGIRIAPGQDPDRLRARAVALLEDDPPWGVRVQVEAGEAVPGWRIEPQGPAYAAAERALRAGYGREPVYIGCGGGIPFVGPFAEVLGGVPALLLGLEDPICNAHGENESIDLGDFAKALRAAAHLFAELGDALSS